MSTREQEARAEAWRRWPQEWFYIGGSTDAGYEPRRVEVEDEGRNAFLAGVEWADAHRPTEPDTDWEYATAGRTSEGNLWDIEFDTHDRVLAHMAECDISSCVAVKRTAIHGPWLPVTPKGEGT